MAEDVTVSEETLTSALSQLVNLGRILLQKARQEAAESLETFVPHKITTLFGLITAGAQLYKSLGVKKKTEAEAVWQKYYHHAAVREQVEELLELEVWMFCAGEQIYRSFGLGSSYAKVINFSCLLQYSEYETNNRELPDVPLRLLEDIYQLGGDFLLDKEGKVLLCHPSKNPLDRPPVKDILKAVDQ
ncbi:selenoprotein L [Morone saxatilis]|uniref:selenoprotein L n=1 Tax=Morone saxatilis TaxID=34816 RepID=UPI0015E240DD|nr:selenoprotein L [Morone saxatilis]